MEGRVTNRNRIAAAERDKGVRDTLQMQRFKFAWRRGSPNIDIRRGSLQSVSYQESLGFAAPTVKLRDGRELRTLSDARALILGVAESRQHRPTWAYAVELFLQAAETGKRADVTDAWAHISRAAYAEGLRAA